jgi:hypothetical protein
MTVGRLLTLTGCIVLISTGSFAQAMSDADYCHQLSTLYRMFSRAPTANAVTAAAMNECDKGNYSVGISRLEEILNGRRIPLLRARSLGTSALQTRATVGGKAQSWPAPWLDPATDEG